MKKHKKIVVGGSSLAVIGCVIYARVSSREQAVQGFSIEAQLKLLRDYALAKGMSILFEFVEVESAKQAGRTLFNKLVKYLRDCGAPLPHIVCEKTDRLYRNYSDFVTLQEMGVTRHFVKDHEIISPASTANELLHHHIKVALATNYSGNLSEETKKGMTEKAEQGMYPSVAPFGYLNVEGADGKKCMVPDPKTAPIIKKMYEWYAEGGNSLDDIGARMKDAGFVSPKTGKAFPRATIQLWLSCRTYSGWFVWNGKLYKGKYEPIVSPELWDYVKRLREQRGSCPEHPQKHEFAYSGVLRCGYSGCLFTGDSKKGGKYTYYFPQHYKGPGKRPRFTEHEIDCLFADVFKQIEFSEDVLNAVSTTLKNDHEERKKFHTEQVARLQAEYTKLNDRLERMYDDKLDDKISEEMFDKKSAQYREEQARLLKTIHAHQTATSAYYDDGLTMLKMARLAHHLFLKLPKLNRRKVVNLLCSNCTLKDGKLEVTLNEPFEELRVTKTALETTKAAELSFDDLCKVWLRGLDSNQQPVD